MRTDEVQLKDETSERSGKEDIIRLEAIRNMSKAAQNGMALGSVLNGRFREVQSETQMFIGCDKIAHVIPSDNSEPQATMHVFCNMILCQKRKCKY